MCEVGNGVETFVYLGLSAMKGVKGNPKWRGVKSGYGTRITYIERL